MSSYPSDEDEGHTYSRSTSSKGEKWCVPRLWTAAKSLPVITVRIEDIPGILTESWVAHWADPDHPEVKFEAVRTQEADLSYPVILHPDGHLMDGYHRVCKALMNGKTTIEAVMFTEATLPLPDITWSKESDPLSQIC